MTAENKGGKDGKGLKEGNSWEEKVRKVELSTKILRWRGGDNSYLNCRHALVIVLVRFLACATLGYFFFEPLCA